MYRFRSSVNRPVIAALAATVLLGGLATACGGDDDSDGTPRGDLAAAMADSLSIIDGISADRDCIEEKAAALTDDQVQAMLESVRNSAEAPADLADWNAEVGDECITIDE